jgi:uncharacterized membrane protein YfbV (UPF0208 family)
MPTATEQLLAGVRRLCLILPEATEGLTHGGETRFVRRRSFAKFVDPQKHRLDERHVAFWAAAPSPDWQEVAEILTDAYRQVAPKFLIARLD